MLLIRQSLPRIKPQLRPASGAIALPYMFLRSSCARASCEVPEYPREPQPTTGQPSRPVVRPPTASQASARWAGY
jgi:hypothetical protein